MNIQKQIFTPQVVDHIQRLVSQQPNLSRRQLSQQLCKSFDWRSANGSLKEVSCRKGLLRLQRSGHIYLPAKQQGPPRAVQRADCLEAIDKTPIEVKLADLGAIEIVPIDSRHRIDSRLWNSLMATYHYLGAGPLCGAQLRYLITSSRYGVLGGFSFSAAAWMLEARDQWIGWDDQARQGNLQRVIGNSRFLILPWVKVANLASYAMGRCLKRLVPDWQERYGFAPLLVETFVDRDRFQGCCYKASNWILVGQTKGRGRQDRYNSYRCSIKDIYVYPLTRDALEVLSEGRKKAKLPAPRDWAEEEFGTARLGDARLVRRLMEIARDFYARPQANIPQACQTRSRTKAAYRFLENKNNSMEKILGSHYESTLKRAGQEKLVLAVQDTTELNYSAHPATTDLGLIGSKQGGPIGLIVHDTLCFNQRGTPLGLIYNQVWARDPADFGKKHLRSKLAIEQKESNKWLKSFQAIKEAQKRSPGTLWVSLGDREADIYELFLMAVSDPSGPRLLVRAAQKRLLAEEQGRLWEYMAGLPESGIQEIKVPRKGKIKARTARLSIRYSQVRLKAPKHRADLAELTIRAVLASEIDCPADVKPLQWLLLTTCPVSSFDEACEKLRWYAMRWGIEIFHRTLKSGCNIEIRQLGSADRIESCLAIDMVVAWRVYHLVKLGRELPEAPCTVYFEDQEWKGMLAYKTKNPIPPSAPPTLREMKRMVASLGGFLGRKCDGDPGTQTIWLGLQRLDDISTMWEISMSIFAPDQVAKPPPGVQ
jgi:hypothetical protein